MKKILLSLTGLLVVILAIFLMYLRNAVVSSDARISQHIILPNENILGFCIAIAAILGIIAWVLIEVYKQEKK